MTDLHPDLYDVAIDPDPDREGRNWYPATPDAGATEEAVRGGRRFTRPAPAAVDDEAALPAPDDDLFTSPAVDDEAGATTTPGPLGGGHAAIGFGAVGTAVAIGGFVIFHLFGGGILIVGAAGAALATSTGVAGVRAARRRRGGPGGAGTGLGGPVGRIRRPGRGARRRAKLLGTGGGKGLGLPKLGGGKGLRLPKLGGGKGLPKLGGKGGPKPPTGPKAGRKIGKGKKPTTTNAARSGGLGPKKTRTPKGGPSGAARRQKMLNRGAGGGGRGGRLSLPKLPKSRRNAPGGGGSSPKGGRHAANNRRANRANAANQTGYPRSPMARRRWANRVGPGAVASTLAGINSATMSPRRRRALTRSVAAAQARQARAAALPRAIRGWRRVGAVTAVGGGLAAFAAGGWIPAVGAAGLGLMLGTSRGRRVMRRAGYHTVWRPTRALIVRPSGRAARWIGRSATVGGWILWRQCVRRPAVHVWGRYVHRPIAYAWHWSLALPGRALRRVRRRVRVWHRKMLVLARYAKTRQAWAAFWAAAVMSLGNLMRWIGRAVWAPKPATPPAAPGRMQMHPDFHDDEQDTDVALQGAAPTIAPLQTHHPDDVRETGAQRRRRMTRPSTTTPAPEPTRAINAGGTMHPCLSRLCEASNQFVAGFAPRSVPDLERYLRSQPDAMRGHRAHYQSLTGHLTQAFPGASGVHAFFARAAEGYNVLANGAATLHSTYRQLHAGDLSRHEQPRVNEHLADIARNGHGGNIPTIGDGSVMHENHACMLSATALNVAGYWPASGIYSPDPVTDLLFYLDTSAEAFFILGVHMRRFAGHLVTAYPVAADVHGYYLSMAAGYGTLSDAAREVARGYRTVNAHDTARREEPRPNEAWADYSNR